ncbi:hypothetical protein B0E38_03358 [Streptomyces sp. 111WW2]|nr:hypothetical protein B0E38_03358 [Streptomyces sp. 111WW2]
MLDADIVVVGAGAAGLSLAHRLPARASLRAVSSVVLVDPPPGPLRPPRRTWCFWEAGPGRFDPRRPPRGSGCGCTGEGEAARWAARTGGCVVELHAYAVPPTAVREVEEKRLVDALHRVYPETRRARVVAARHEWRADCPLFTVGGYRDRPTVRAPDPALVVAGDLVRTDLPVALMERAATSGFLAANALLEPWGVQGRDAVDGARRGPLRAAACPGATVRDALTRHRAGRPRWLRTCSRRVAGPAARAERTGGSQFLLGLQTGQFAAGQPCHHGRQ